MKNLVYKELKLSMHPLCYIFTFAFPFLTLIPNFPLFAASIYIIPGLSILFLGANKAKQSNDLFYTALLPVRKKDIVAARMCSVLFMELCTLALLIMLFPLKIFIQSKLPVIPGKTPDPYIAITSQGGIACFSFMLVALLIPNACYFLAFYRTGRSIVAPTIISTFAYMIFLGIFTILLPLTSKGFASFFTSKNIGVIIGTIIGAVAIFIPATLFIVKKAGDLLNKADIL